MNEEMRGKLAQQVLDNPVYKESLIILTAQVVDEWKKCKWFQKRKKEHLWLKMQVLDEIKTNIEREIKKGIIAEMRKQKRA